MWFIGVEVEQETSAPPPKKNPGSAPVPTQLTDNQALISAIYVSIIRLSKDFTVTVTATESPAFSQRRRRLQKEKGKTHVITESSHGWNTFPRRNREICLALKEIKTVSFFVLTGLFIFTCPYYKQKSGKSV